MYLIIPSAPKVLELRYKFFISIIYRTMKSQSFNLSIVSCVMTHFTVVSLIEGTTRGNFKVNLGRVEPLFKGLWF